MQNPTHLVIPKLYFLKETEKAYCFQFDGPGAYANLPKSRIRDFQLIGENYDFWIEEWLIETNGLEMFIDTSYAPSLF